MPRRLIGAWVLSVAGLLALAAPAAWAGVDPAPSYADALAAAKQNNQLLVIDFFTDW